MPNAGFDFDQTVLARRKFVGQIEVGPPRLAARLTFGGTLGEARHRTWGGLHQHRAAVRRLQQAGQADQPQLSRTVKRGDGRLSGIHVKAHQPRTNRHRMGRLPHDGHFQVLGPHLDFPIHPQSLGHLERAVAHHVAIAFQIRCRQRLDGTVSRRHARLNPIHPFGSQKVDVQFALSFAIPTKVSDLRLTARKDELLPRGTDFNLVRAFLDSHLIVNCRNQHRFGVPQSRR